MTVHDEVLRICATSSGRLELSPSSSLPTLLDSSIRCSPKRLEVSGSVVFHFMDLKLQNPAPVDLEGASQEPSHTVPASKNCIL